MKTIETKLCVGAANPFFAIHLSDTHLTYADERDGERKVILAQKRKIIFEGSETILSAASQKSHQYNAPILHTGDLIDFVSLANLERAKRFFSENDCFVAAGNHEFSLYVGEAWEDEAYRNQSLALVQSAYPNDIRMSSRIIGGVNFVALDNGYYLFEDAQTEFVQEQAKKGFPIVLLLHNPLYEETLFNMLMNPNGGSAGIVGVPEEKMTAYPPYRLRQQKADEATNRALQYFSTEPLIKAILCGHVHVSYEGTWHGIPQIITGLQELRMIQFS